MKCIFEADKTISNLKRNWVLFDIQLVLWQSYLHLNLWLATVCSTFFSFRISIKSKILNIMCQPYRTLIWKRYCLYRVKVFHVIIFILIFLNAPFNESVFKNIWRINQNIISCKYLQSKNRIEFQFRCQLTNWQIHRKVPLMVDLKLWVER